MEKINKIWQKVSYEIILIIVFLFQFLTKRSLDLQGWSAAWNAMDYSMGSGSRLLIGSIYRLFYGEYLDYTVAYKYTAAGIMITSIVLAITLGRLIRIASANVPEDRTAVIGTVMIYAAAPWSIGYVWNTANLGRFDVYMLLIGLLAVLSALLIRNVYVRYLFYTVLSVIGIAIHQGFAFLYYPMVLIVMCYEVFRDNRLHVRQFVITVISGMITAVVAVYFQFFSHLNFDSAAEVVEAVRNRTNLPVVEWAIEIEYFGGLKYQLERITPVFFAYEKPWIHMLLILLLLAPALGLYVVVWKDVFHYLKINQIKIYRSPYLYVLLTHLCYVPMFLIHTDWGRHFAPWFALPTFIFLFYLAKEDRAMAYAYEKMRFRVKKYPLCFVAIIIWISFFDHFGARAPFQDDEKAIYNLLDYGFYIN